MNDTEPRSQTSPPAFNNSELMPSPSAFTIIDRELRINEALPGLVKHEPTALLLDINNLFMRSKENGFSLDFSKLYDIFNNRCDLRLASAFSAVDQRDSKATEWVEYMQRKGYVLKTKKLMRYTNDEGGVTTKGNMDIEICLDAVELSPSFGHIILGTCDGDFVPLVEFLRKGRYRKVSVLGISNQQRSGMSKALIDAADNFYDMAEIRDLIVYRNHRHA